MAERDPSRYGLRGELLWHLSRIRRLRAVTAALAVVALAFGVLVVSGPGAMSLSTWMRDPGFAALDELPLPRWASTRPSDTAEGSRWCVDRCMVRQRQWTSLADVAATSAAFRVAFDSASWTRVPRSYCAGAEDSAAVQCFRRDAWRLRLIVAPIACGDDFACEGAVVTAVMAPATTRGDRVG